MATSQAAHLEKLYRTLEKPGELQQRRGYWGEDDSVPKSRFTLEALHELAEQRSRERSKKRQLLESEGESDGNTDSACCNQKGHNGEACMRRKEKVRSTPRCKKMRKCLGTSGTVETVKDASVVLDAPFIKKNGHLPKKNNHVTKEKMDLLSASDLDSEEEAEQEEEAEEDEEEEEEQLEAEEKKFADEGSPSSKDSPTLQPLVHMRSKDSSKCAAVQRQLPDWITNAHIIENDIAQFSRPISDFSLPPLLVNNLSNIGLKQFFPVQVHVLPHLLSSLHGPLRTSLGGYVAPDVCVCAPTGCGKTLCYVLPIVTALMTRVLQQVRALIVVPSHELASQVLNVFNQMIHGTGLSAGLVSGQLSLELECSMLHEQGSYPAGSKVDMLVATPGRLVEHLDRCSFASLAYLRFLVIDEADKLLDSHFNQWLPKLLNAVTVAKTTPSGCDLRGPSLGNAMQGLCGHLGRVQLWKTSTRKHTTAKPLISHFSASGDRRDAHFHIPASSLQKLLFSASMTHSPEHLSQLQLHTPHLFTTHTPMQRGKKGGGGESSDITFTLPTQLMEKLVRCDIQHKPLALLHLLTCDKGCGEMARVLCFTNSRDSTHRLYLLLKTFGLFSVDEMSGSIGQAQRQHVLSSFRTGKTKVLVCSDQMARGMDVEGVTCVVNYEAPRQFRIYLHRAGRTARAGQKGVVYTLLAKEEVHAFKVMIRKAVGEKKMADIKISSSDLQDFLPQYQDALDTLKQMLK